MSFQLRKIVYAATLGALVAGCDQSAGLTIAMSASFAEQFTAACGEDVECKSAVNSHGFDCFDDNLARDAITSSAAAKRRINSEHILKYQRCVAAKAGTDYWAGENMPEFILGQLRG